MAFKTIPNLFEESVNNFPNNPLMWEHTGNKYESLSYAKMKEIVYQFSAGLRMLGLEKGDRVTLLSEGRNDWVISELAVLYAGGVNVPISVKLDELNDLKFRISHSESKFVIVSKNHFHKIEKIKSDLPIVEKVILLDEIQSKDDDLISKSKILEMGIEYLDKNEDEFINLWKYIKEDDFANICYTSGTTADPKGIILTHRNYTANVEQATALLPIPEDYISLLILPWDHSFAHTAGIYTLMQNGASMASIQVGATPLETLKNIPENIKEIKPTFLLSVPALAKNFKKNIEKGIMAKGEKVEKLFNKALAAAYDYNGLGWDKGKGIKVLKKPLIAFYDKILFSKIRDGFGGRLKFFIGGGALLDIELQKFFYAIGIPMYQGYGLSEAAPIISANVPAKHKMGSSGYPVVNLEIMICNEDGIKVPDGEKGEIVVKGENVMAGYWKNDEASKEVLKDGWLYTGDMGYLDNDGFLYVLGRFKSLLISSDGEKYSPEGIEEALTDHSTFIDQVMLHNNQSPYTVALIVPNKENIKNYLKQNGLSVSDDIGQTSAINLIKSEIDKYKDGGDFSGEFPARWLPASFAILGEGFTEENKFLNSTLKMVRGKITEFYKDRIDSLFDGEGKDILNHQNKKIISRF